MLDCTMTSQKEYFVLYDNLCLFCGRARSIITALDWFSRIETVPLYDRERLAQAKLPIPPEEDLLRELHLIEKSGRVHRGFYACRKIGLLLPLTLPFALVLYIPGAAYIGEKIYAHIANTRT